MPKFGDPPVSNPSYQALSPFFFKAPLAFAGVAVGLLAGCGRPGLLPVMVRLLCGPGAVIFVLFLSGGADREFLVFAPLSLEFFVVAVCASAFYNALIARAGRKAVQTAPDTERMP